MNVFARFRDRASKRRVNDAVLLSGLGELALGALTGWPYALVVSDPDRARRLGIRSAARLRQWHLDLIALGSLSILAATAMPDLPRRVGLPLAIGCWTNASSFGVLTFWPQLRERRVYAAAVGASFICATWGFTSLAALGFHRAEPDARLLAAFAGGRCPPDRSRCPPEPDGS